MIMAVLFAGILVAMVLSLSLVFIPKIKVAGDVKKSVAAAYAAESAIEWCLYVNRIGVANQPVMSNNAVYINGNSPIGAPFAAVPPRPGDCVSPVKALGTYQGVTRSFEISF